MPCSSQWYHNNYTCPLSCDETLTTRLLGIYLCTVKCHVKGNDYFYETLKVTVVEPTKPPPLIESGGENYKVWLIPLFVLLSVAIVASIVVVLGLLYVRRKRRLIEEAETSSEEETPLIETTPESGDTWDLTVLHQEVFILRYKRRDIEVYDSTEFHFKRRMKLDGMTCPESIASCSVNKCLYTIDSSHQKLRPAILRIEPSNGKVIKAWKLTSGWSHLSVASDANVIICPLNDSDLYEYTADGELIRMIDLGRNPVYMTQRISAVHAVKLDNGLFVVCQYDPGEVYLISTKATSSTLGRIYEVEILKKFSEESGDFIDSSWRPFYLSVDKEGSILVSDAYNNQTMLLNSNFDKAQILISKEDGMESPEFRTCFNESTGEWLVNDRRRIFVCRVKGETIERKIRFLISDGEAQPSSDEETPLVETAWESGDTWDLTVLDKEAFILRYEHRDIEVYDSTDFHFKRRMKVDGMTCPESIASCSVNKCLYTIDSSHQILRYAILRIEPSNGKVIKVWNFTGARSDLSVASDTNVIICPNNGSDLYEYTADGELVRVINLGRNPVDMTQRISAMHAVKLDNGLFVVCQIDPGEVYLISTKETSSTLGRIDEVEILNKFNEESGYLIDSSWRPYYLSVDKEGSILVSDAYNNQTMLLNSKFDQAQILIFKEDGMESPEFRTCFNESTDEWLVNDRHRIFVCRVKGETIERKIRFLISDGEISFLTVLYEEIFIVRFERKDIEVYDSTEFHFKRRMEVDGMTDPGSIASCTVNKCLYIFVLSHQELHHAILKIDPSNGNLIKVWKLTGVFRDWSYLTVATDTNVIVCPDNGSDLYEYTADGELVRTIDLGRNPVDMTQCIRAMHAVKLDNGFLVVCQSDPGEVYLLSTKEAPSTTQRVDEVELLKKFSEELGDFNDSSWEPLHLSVGKEGSILVSDKRNDRAVLFNSNFDEARILVSKEDEMESPWRTCFNESTGEWIVADDYRICVCRVKGETIERQIHELISH